MLLRAQVTGPTVSGRRRLEGGSRFRAIRLNARLYLHGAEDVVTGFFFVERPAYHIGERLPIDPDTRARAQTSLIPNQTCSTLVCVLSFGSSRSWPPLVPPCVKHRYIFKVLLGISNCNRAQSPARGGTDIQNQKQKKKRKKYRKKTLSYLNWESSRCF